MLRRLCSTNSLLGLNGKMFMRKGWSRPSSPRLPRKQIHGILTRSSQHRPSLLHHPDKKTAWSRLTANGDPTSHSFPTLRVEQPKHTPLFLWSHHFPSPHQTAHPTTGVFTTSFHYFTSVSDSIVEQTFAICRFGNYTLENTPYYTNEKPLICFCGLLRLF